MKWSWIAFSSCFLLGASAQAAVNIYGPGGMTCARYTQSSPSDKDAFKYWGQGYLSGINSMKGFDITRGKDQATVLQWIDNYCQANPQSSYNGAVDSMILDINK